MIKKIIIIILLVIGVSSVYSINVTKEINISESQLPYFNTDSFLFQLNGNETLFFNNTNVTNSNVIMQFPTNYTLNSTETNYTLNVSYQINPFVLFNNLTILKKNVFINNTLNNVTTTIKYIFNINKSQPNGSTINNNSQVFNVEITSNGYNITISSNTLPKVGSSDFTITGIPLSNGTVTYCGEFLVCPTSFNFDVNGQAILNIQYNIPYGQQIGSYTRIFAIQSNNTFKQGTLIFNIISPQYIIQHYVYNDSCFLNKQTMISCVREQQNFDSKRLSDFINQIMKKDVSTCPTVNETIKYVMQGEINNDLKSLYNSCVSDLNSSKINANNLVEELKNMRVENSKLLTSKDNILSDANLQVKNAQDKAFEIKINSEKNIKNQQLKSKSDIDWWTNFIIFSILFMIGISYYTYRFAKENWW